MGLGFSRELRVEGWSSEFQGYLERFLGMPDWTASSFAVWGPKP